MIFVETTSFSSLISEYLSDEEYSALQYELVLNPGLGNIIPGTGGLRKMRYRYAGKGKGKRSGLRLIYYWYTKKDRIYLFSVYYKGEVTDLSTKDKKQLKQLLEAWKNEQT